MAGVRKRRRKAGQGRARKGGEENSPLSVTPRRGLAFTAPLAGRSSGFKNHGDSSNKALMAPRVCTVTLCLARPGCVTPEVLTPSSEQPARCIITLLELLMGRRA